MVLLQVRSRGVRDEARRAGGEEFGREVDWLYSLGVRASRLSRSVVKSCVCLKETTDTEAGELRLSLGCLRSVRASDSLVEFRDPDGVLFDVPAPPILAAVKQQQQALLSPEQQKERLAQRQEKIG